MELGYGSAAPGAPPRTAGRRRTAMARRDDASAGARPGPGFSLSGSPRGGDLDVSAATPRTVRAINDRVALELLLEHGTLTRTQLAELTGLSKPTATQLLQRLAETDLIVPRGTTSGAPGPNAQLYALNERAAFVAAVDVDEHRVSAAVADLAGKTLGEVSHEVDYTGHDDPVP